MSSERKQRKASTVVGEAFGLTYHEELFDRVLHQRFIDILSEQTTTIHQISVDNNQFGEFLFVTLSRPSKLQPALVTFWGLGFHEYRERWLTQEWNWYSANHFPKTLEQRLTHEEALQLIQARRDEIAPHLGDTQQSGRGKLFEMLADMFDEDDALAEFEDLGDDLAGLLGGDTPF